MAKKEEKKTDTKGQEEVNAKKPPLMLIIIALSALLVIGGGVAAYFIFFKAPADEEVAVEHDKKNAKDKDERGKKKGDKDYSEPVNINLDPFLVNLAEPKAKHFLKVSITLQIKDEATKPDVEKKIANIKNDILLLLSSKTIEDVITMEGKIRLKEEMMIRITKIVGEDKVTDIFFSQFVVQ